MAMRLLIDGVFFQIATSGIARVWSAILPLMAKNPALEITLLDRGRSPSVEGIRTIPFPSFGFSNGPADSSLIQQICDELEIDVFSSTYYTTPLTTPMAMMVYDMIPELFDFDMSLRGWMEKETAIAYARRFVCISSCTRKDLLSFYPEIPPQDVGVAHCGVDPIVFRPRGEKELSAFRAEHNLSRPYFLFVGSRTQHKGYKNASLFFDAISSYLTADFDVFCVGGEPKIETEVFRKMPRGSSVKRVELTDDELSLAYSGAAALVYPSLYEGFGLPVIEAMACGCPVITTSHGSLLEAAGDAALLISGISGEEMRRAIGSMLTDDKLRAELRQKGLAHAATFKWETMADAMTACLERVLESSGEADRDFYLRWRSLRLLQGTVDYH